MIYRLALLPVFLISSLNANCGGSDVVDVIHYQFYLEMTDSTNVIAGESWVTVQFKRASKEFDLDLVNQRASGTGMKITQVRLGSTALSFTHQSDRVHITLPSVATAEEYRTIHVIYSGIPAEGLIIRKNKFGDRTFFADNWPDRAHHWLPTIDHPSDKATCEFIVTAPEQYQVVSNGKRIEESSLPRKRKLTHWSETAPISTKVMVIGVARFAVQVSGTVGKISIESWVYPQNRIEGFTDYADAVDVFAFMENHLGDYSYEKLANVQSTTLYGALENASAIFYAESSVTGKNEMQSLLGHEIAHQWFGNSATEKDWQHVWLSEGVSTYLSHLYIEFTKGRDSLDVMLREERQQVIQFAKLSSDPIVDTTYTQPIELLNVNSYQKASWVLHMLRREMGDPSFWKGLQTYYSRFKNSNADTDDFQEVMESTAGIDLSIFFKEWFWTGRHPRISVRWKHDPKKGALEVSIQQTSGLFHFPLDIQVRASDGSTKLHTVTIGEKTSKFTLITAKKPTIVVLDPATWLLFEGEIRPE